MSGNVDPGDIFAGGGIPYVDAEMKAELARNKTPLGIIDATPKATNQFGDDETSFIVRGKSLDGDFKLALSHNEVRERQAKAVLDRIAAGATSVGPVYLVQVKTRSNKTAWALDAEPGDGNVEATASDGGSDFGGGAAAAAAGDDGIPY